MISELQKQKFLEVSGFEYIESHGLKGLMLTPFPCNDKTWDLSPWNFRYVYDINTGYLHMELDHRMTNNRIFCVDSNGGSINGEEQFKYFKQHL